MTWTLATEQQQVGRGCDQCRLHVAGWYWYDADADFTVCSLVCAEARDQQVAETQAAQA